MIGERQEKLLKCIVENYIKTARPVGSKSLNEELKCSSATVRNEMAILEEMGFLEKTHTSSGRIPSNKGYHYYVDHIMKPSELNGEEMLKLQTIFKNNSLVLTDAIKLSMELVSEITNYTTVVLGKSSFDNKIVKVEVIPINSNNLVTVIATDKGHVEHKNVYLNERVNLDEIKKTVDLINKLIVGTPISEASSKLEYEVKPIIGKYIKQHDVLYKAFYNAFSEFANDIDIKMSGKNNILNEPEFNDVDKIRELLPKFDQDNLINSIKEEEDGINVYIGKESEFDSDITVVKTKYEKNGKEGTLALIGPKRMDYKKVISLLDFIKKNIER